MFKKALSILLALMLIVSSVSITAISVAAADGDQEVTYTVAGSSAAMFGTTWDATNTANDMSFDEEEQLYKITYSAVEPENAIQLKVVKNHAWDEAWGDKDTGDNYTFNVTEVCDVTVTFDPDTQEVNVTGDGVTQDTDLDVTSVIAVGNGEETYLNGANWDPCDQSNALTEDPENPGVWKMTMEDIYAFDNYNIKFAINSVDDQGNPTSNPWAHNFGSEVEQLYPTNEELEAVYNGKNCIFEVEEDGSTVEFTLDLRNFDFKTKKGAKMTIAVTAPESDVTTAPAEETTVAPEPQETTVAPAPAGDGLTVKATSNLFVADTQYYAENPDTVTVNYYMNAVSPLKLQAIQFGITYDSNIFSFDPAKNGEWDEDEEDYDYSQMFPVANGVGDVNPKTDASEIKFAVAKWDGLNLRKSGNLIPIATVVFDVKDGAKGVTEITNTVEAAALTNSKTEEDYIIYNINGLQQEAYDFVTGGDPTTLYSGVGPEGTEPPVEPTTVADTTAADTTAEETTAEATTVEPTTAEPTTAPVEPTTEPEPVDHIYTVAGSSAAMFGTTWDATNAANDMTKGDDGKWSITYPDVQPEDAIQLKVVEDHAWDHAWGDKETGDNYTFNVVSPCDVTVTFDPATETVTVSGDGVTQDTDLDVYSVIAVGNGEETYLNGANWDPCDQSNALTQVSDGIWEMTMEDIYAFDNYNIKFAINSVDEQGNPTSNPWAHNFGSEVEQLYPTGEELDAVYNGKNCIFEVEEDGSTVKFQLDLRDFDFKTKKGAKMTITVTPPSEEPTSEEVTTEPAPIGGDSLTVNATSNLFTPDQATYYYNSAEGVPETVTVTYYMDVDKALQLQAIQFGVTYDPEYLTFDPDKNGYYDEDAEEYNYDQMFPVANGVGDVNPITDKNIIRFAVAKWDGLKLKKNGELVPIATVTFDVKDGAKGVTDVDCKIAACSLTNPKTEEDYIIYNVNGLQQEAYDFVTGGDPSTLYGVIEPAGNTPVVEPTTEVDTTVAEPTTVEPTTVEPTTAEPTTVEPTTAEATTVAPTTAPAPTGDSLTVNATSNLFTPDQATYYYNSEEGVPETVTVTYYMDVDKALQLQAIQFGITYDPEYLTFDPDKNGYYDEDAEEYNYDQMFPVANGVGDVNPMPDKNIIRFAVAKWDGLKLKKNGELVPIATVTFDVKDGAKGVTDVDCQVAACSLTNPKTEEDYIIYNVHGLQQEAYDFVTGGDPSTLYGVIEPAGNTPVTEPTTEADTTAEPTTVEPTTVEPTTVAPTTAEPTTVAPVTDLNVTSTSNMFPTATQVVKVDDFFYVTYQLDAAHDVDSFQWKMTYDPEKLECTGVSTPGVEEFVTINAETGKVRAAASNATDPFKYSMGDVFAEFQFKALDGGDTEVVFDVQVFEEHDPSIDPTTAEPTTVEPTTAEPTTEEPTTEPVEPTTEEPTTAPVEPTTVEPTTAEPTTVEPTTAEPTTVEPTTAEPTTVEPTTAEPTTVEPTTAPVEPTTAEPTTAPVEPTTVEPTTVPSGVTVTGPDTYVKGSDDKLVFTVTGADPEDCTGIKVNGEEVPAENYTVEKTDDGFTVTFNKDYADNLNDGETTFDFTIDGETYTSKVNVTSTEPGTTSTDATSATGEEGTTTAGDGSSDGSGSTSDSGSGSSSSSSGAVQTGSASMAIIILLVLVSATAGIYFARKRREEK